jgi:hypothetical protein
LAEGTFAGDRSVSNHLKREMQLQTARKAMLVELLASGQAAAAHGLV